LEEGIKEMGKGVWESQVKVSDDVVYNAIVARGGGVLQVSDNIIDFSEGNCFVCSLEVDVLFEKIR
jgi:hypothetical protein